MISSDYKDRKGYFLAGTIFIITLIFPALSILSGSRETMVTTSKSDVTIKGMYGLTIKYIDITQLDTLASLPRISIRTNGLALGNTFKGNFRLVDQANARLFIRYGYTPYIFIKTVDLHIYLNFKDPEKTLDLYKTLKTSLGQLKN